MIKDFFENDEVPTQNIDLSVFGISGYQLDVKREDLLHSTISGNKFRKLKYNLLAAEKSGKKVLLTFGGAFSNHISAVAAAGEEFGFKTIGIIRGEELANKPLNPTVSFAQKCGMKLHFVSRSSYRIKENPEFVEKLKDEFGDFCLIPEGGTNKLAVTGCKEIIGTEDENYDYICLAVGTGGTLAGILESMGRHQKIIGFSVLNGVFQNREIRKYSAKTNYELTDAYSFGGYGKIDEELIRFINKFKKKTGIQLDPIYTGKLFYGIFKDLKNGLFKKNSRILAVHSGGIQGIAGINKILLNKNLPLIH